jgi:hypothetical protein
MTSSGYKGKSSLGRSHADILYYSKDNVYIPVKKIHVSIEIDPGVHKNRSRSPKLRSISEDLDFVSKIS